MKIRGELGSCAPYARSCVLNQYFGSLRRRGSNFLVEKRWLADKRKNVARKYMTCILFQTAFIEKKRYFARASYRNCSEFFLGCRNLRRRSRRNVTQLYGWRFVLETITKHTNGWWRCVTFLRSWVVAMNKSLVSSLQYRYTYCHSNGAVMFDTQLNRCF